MQEDRWSAGVATEAPVGAIRDRGGGTTELELDSKRPRKAAPASEGSEVKDDPKCPCWVKRLGCSNLLRWVILCLTIYLLCLPILSLYVRGLKFHLGFTWLIFPSELWFMKFTKNSQFLAPELWLMLRKHN